MLKLSTGDDSTLGNYLKLTEAFLGADSKAAEFLRKKIAEQGENQEVITPEAQMIQLLFSL